MSITELGALGEFIGSIAVVFSLIYLAVQVRQNMRMVRASVRQSISEDVQKLSLLAFEHPDVAVLMEAARSERELSDPDSNRLMYGIRYFFRVWENAYQQHRDNLFDEREWESHKQNIRYWCDLGAFKKVIADPSFLTTLEPEFVEEFRKTIAI